MQTARFLLLIGLVLANAWVVQADPSASCDKTCGGYLFMYDSLRDCHSGGDLECFITTCSAHCPACGYPDHEMWNDHCHTPIMCQYC